MIQINQAKNNTECLSKVSIHHKMSTGGMNTVLPEDLPSVGVLMLVVKIAG